MKKNYIICAPAYGKSNGIRTLYRLAHLLEERGYASFIYPGGYPQEVGYHYLNTVTEEMRQNDIVIYPEIIVGNPLRFRNVIRYVLYYPGELGGERGYHPSEKIYAWNSKYYSNVPVLNLCGIDDSLFYDEHLGKKQNCYFIHKGGLWKDIPEIKDAIKITMTWPEKRSDLAYLLKTTKNLYSYDRNSLLNDEAYLCGAQVKIVTESGLEDYVPAQIFSKKLLEKQLSEFIDASQAMNYQGELEPVRRTTSFYWIKVFCFRLLSLTKNQYLIEKYNKYRIKQLAKRIGL